MNITIVDWVPGAGVTRWLTAIERSNYEWKKDGVIVIPNFADISLSNHGLKGRDMSEQLRWSTIELAEKIMQAEEQGMDLVIGGSPVSYYAYAILQWKRIDTQSIVAYEKAMKTISAHARVLLLRKSREGDITTKSPRIIHPEKVMIFEDEIESEYRRLMKNSDIQSIQRIGDSIWVTIES